MSEALKLERHLIQTSVEHAEGTQTWWVDAASKEDALAKFEAGGCDIYCSEVEVTKLGEPVHIDTTSLDDFGDDDQARCMSEKKTAWVAYTNTDLTEGRGHDAPIAVCEAEATAIRLARKRYVQGSDGPVRAIELVKINNKWHAPVDDLAIIHAASREDKVAQDAIDAKREAIAKARAAGLTDADLAALGLRVEK